MFLDRSAVRGGRLDWFGFGDRFGLWFPEFANELESILSHLPNRSCPYPLSRKEGVGGTLDESDSFAEEGLVGASHFFFELCIVVRVQATKVIERKLTSETEWLDSSTHLEKTGDSIGRRGASRTVQSKRPYFSTWP